MLLELRGMGGGSRRRLLCLLGGSLGVLAYLLRLFQGIRYGSWDVTQDSFAGGATVLLSLL